MRTTPAARRAVAVVGAALLLALASSSDDLVQAGSRGRGLPGTWFVSLPGGLTGFYTYNQDGTMIGTVSTVFGAPPQPPGPLTLGGADHGIWRRVGDGFEGVVFRMFFDSASGNPVSIIGIHTFFQFDPGRHSTSGTFTAALWLCPVAPDPCPDPNSTPPDIPDLTPPSPLDTFTQTRVVMP